MSLAAARTAQSLCRAVGSTELTMHGRGLHSVHAEHDIGTAGSCMLLVQARPDCRRYTC